MWLQEDGKMVEDNICKEKMKSFISFIGTLLRISVISLVVSAIFWAAQWLLSLMSICSKPNLGKFIGGAIAIFTILFLYSIIQTAITLYRFHKDPVFKDTHLKTGMSWKDYKRFKSYDQ